MMMGAADSAAVELEVGCDGVVGPQEVVNIPVLLDVKKIIITVNDKNTWPYY